MERVDESELLATATAQFNQRSVIFFNDIAASGDSDFVRQFREEFRENYVDDMLRQIWSNSEILRERFHYLQQGYKSLAIAVIPWLTAITYSANLNHYVKL